MPSQQTSKEDGLFRQSALDSLNVQEESEGEAQVTSPSVYILLATMIIILAAVFVWGIFGNITDKSEISGIIFPVEGVQDVTLPNRGTVRSLFIHNGDNVSRGQSLAMVSVEDAYSMISVPSDGIVIDVKSENETFEAFEPIATILAGENDAPHSLVAFVPFEVSSKFRPGMKIEVTPKNLSREKNGYITGQVTEVSKYPVSKDEASRRLKTDTFADDLFPEHGAAFEVRMTLDILEDGSPAWSFTPDYPVDMATGTFCSIQVITNRRSVYRYLFEDVRNTARKVKMSLE